MAKKKGTTKGKKAPTASAGKPAASKWTHVATLLKNVEYYDGKTSFKKGVPTKIDGVTAAHLLAKEPKKFKVELLADVEARERSAAAAQEAVEEAGDGSGDEA